MSYIHRAHWNRTPIAEWPAGLRGKSLFTASTGLVSNADANGAVGAAAELAGTELPVLAT
jgi:hypothetical protein